MHSQNIQVAGYKISIQKPGAFIYTNKELSGREIKKQSHLKLDQKRINYLGRNDLRSWKMYTLKTVDTDKRNWRWHK